MANPNIQNIDSGWVQISDPVVSDELITFSAAGTLASGTILARDTGTLKLIPFVKGGTTTGNGIPKAVLQYPVTAAGAGDVAARPLIGGKVRKDKLIILADGDATNVDKAVEDALRLTGFFVQSVTNLSKLDNQ
jgi:hypothetical protein